jgi:hypothetical protein
MSVWFVVLLALLGVFVLYVVVRFLLICWAFSVFNASKRGRK